MRNIKFIGLILTFALLSCNSHKKNVKIKCYHVNSGGDNTFLWYYVMTNSDGSYYYYNSPTQVTNFSNVTWTETPSLPSEITGATLTSEVVAPLSELSENVQSDVSVDGDGGGNSDGGSSGGDGGSSGGDGGGCDGGGDGGGGD